MHELGDNSTCPVSSNDCDPVGSEKVADPFTCTTGWANPAGTVKLCEPLKIPPESTPGTLAKAAGFHAGVAVQLKLETVVDNPLAMKKEGPAVNFRGKFPPGGGGGGGGAASRRGILNSAV
jgi:hypothetical protein